MNIPVVPAAIDGTMAILAKHVHYIKPFKKVILKYGEPLIPDNYENPEVFADECWNNVNKIHSEIKNLSF